jgi:hypothetical protein
MKLRHVLLLASAVGACGALLLTMDMFRRAKDAEAALLVRGGPVERRSETPRKGDALAAAAQPVAPALPPEASVLNFLTVHAMALLSLAFLFLAVFLLLIAALRDRTFASALDCDVPAKPLPTADAPPTPPTVTPLSDMARQAEPFAVEPDSSAAIEVFPEPPQPAPDKAGEP